MEYEVYALASYNDGTGPALYAGGWFEDAGGVTVYNIARCDGTQWFALDDGGDVGVDEEVDALTVYDPGTGSELYAAGWFDWAGSGRASCIASWDGSGWSTLDGPSGEGLDEQAFAVVEFDAGEGPALYVGGNFTAAGGVPSSRIAVWSCETALFADGFESGDTSAWDMVVGGS